MQSTDFCYWLQGWFELEEPKKITSEQLDTISAHLALVFQYDAQPNRFCQSLQGFLAFNEEHTPGMSVKQTQTLKHMLEDTFRNEIDTRYSAKEFDVLNTIHNVFQPEKKTSKKSHTTHTNSDTDWRNKRMMC
jgi:hypothetical protein